MADVRLELLTLCDHALTSKEGKLSVIGIFDRMFVQKIPTSFARFFVVAVLIGDPNSQHNVSLSIKDPQGNEVLTQVKKIAIKLGSTGRSNILTDIVNTPLQATGEYEVRLILGDKQLGSTKLEVVKLTHDQAGKEKLPN